MGWNLQLSLVRDRTTADLAELGASLGMFALSGEPVTGEEGRRPRGRGLDLLDEDWLFTLPERRTGLGEDWLDLPAYPLVGVAFRG